MCRLMPGDQLEKSKVSYDWVVNGRSFQTLPVTNTEGKNLSGDVLFNLAHMDERLTGKNIELHNIQFLASIIAM